MPTVAGGPRSSRAHAYVLEILIGGLSPVRVVVERESTTMRLELWSTPSSRVSAHDGPCQVPAHCSRFAPRETRSYGTSNKRTSDIQGTHRTAAERMYMRIVLRSQYSE